MEQSYSVLVGLVISAKYYEELRVIRAVLQVNDGRNIKVEIPMAMFSFDPGMNRHAEMDKTAKMMCGKKIKVMSTAEPT